MSDLQLDDFDYDLPAELIAQRPAGRRDDARLLVVTPQGVRHQGVRDLPELIERLVGPGTLLVVNDTQVIPARLSGRKVHLGALGGAVELLLCDPVQAGAADGGRWVETWRCLYRASKPLRPGAAVALDGQRPPAAAIVANEGNGRVLVDFTGDEPGGLLAALRRVGQVPLPPYIRREGPMDPAQRADDERRYQTVYAREPGAVAAPTAGLHFTAEMLADLEARGLRRAAVTLHVGPGTFAPVKVGDLSQHVMHVERYHVPEETAEAIRCARAEGRKVLAVGTTVVRTLESATLEGERVPRAGRGESGLFIRPPYRFRVVDALLTNFHLPRSTLLMLVAAFAGRRRCLHAYAEAVKERYRFFSYGDAMLLPCPMEDE